MVDEFDDLEALAELADDPPALPPRATASPAVSPGGISPGRLRLAIELALASDEGREIVAAAVRRQLPALFQNYVKGHPFKALVRRAVTYILASHTLPPARRNTGE